MRWRALFAGAVVVALIVGYFLAKKHDFKPQLTAIEVRVSKSLDSMKPADPDRVEKQAKVAATAAAASGASGPSR